jgi:hypothetical protein
VGFGDLAFFAEGGGFGDSGGLCAAGGFDALGGSRTSCLLGLTQRALRGGIGFVGLVMPGGRDCAAFGRVCRDCGGFGLGLGKKRLLADLLCGTMSQLRTVLAARGGEIAIFRSMQIGPGVKNGHIFRSLRDHKIIGFICAVRVHGSWFRALS